MIPLSSPHQAKGKGQKMARYGYARVSTDGQEIRLQRDALSDARCERIFEDQGSGGNLNRPMLRRLLSLLVAGDVVVVWKMDRLSRSLRDLLGLLEEIQDKGAAFVSLTEAIDTTTPAGRMVANMIGVFAEFERAMVSERTKAGMKAAVARGEHIGRPRALTAPQRAEIVLRVGCGEWSQAEAARLFGVSKATVSRLFG